MCNSDKQFAEKIRRRRIAAVRRVKTCVRFSSPRIATSKTENDILL